MLRKLLPQLTLEVWRDQRLNTVKTRKKRLLFLLAISAPRTTVQLVITSIRWLARPTWQPPARREALRSAVLVPENELESVLVLLIQSKAKLLFLLYEVLSDELGKPG
jgi:hypothetical protein